MSCTDANFEFSNSLGAAHVTGSETSNIVASLKILYRSNNIVSGVDIPGVVYWHIDRRGSQHAKFL